MKKIEFKVDINAPKEKVWETLWDYQTYKRWTSIFNEDSQVITDWKEGSKIFVLSDKGDGMYSIIAKNVPNTQMSFMHLGIMKDGKEHPYKNETKKWLGAMENYSLSESGGITSVQVTMDVADEFSALFKEKFPKALENLKMLVERQSVEDFASH